MRADPNIQMAKNNGLRCSAARQNTELCGDDHTHVTRGRMRAQYPLPHGRATPPPPGGGDLSFTISRGNISCSGLSSPFVTHAFLHCFPITLNSSHVCIL